MKPYIAYLANRHWIGPAYMAFAAALLTITTLQYQVLLQLPAIPLLLFVALAVTALLTGGVMLASPSTFASYAAIALLLLETALALMLIAVTGSYASPLWVTLLLVSVAAPLLLARRDALFLLIFGWLASGIFLFQAPVDQLLGALILWAFRAASVLLLIALVLRAIETEVTRQRWGQRREQALQAFLQLSNRLWNSPQPETILEEIARTTQASGPFTCVTIGRVEPQQLTIDLAFGASGRRLQALEGLQVAWQAYAPEAGQGSYQLTEVPFRSIAGEEHIILPLPSQSGVPQRIITVSAATKYHAVVHDARPLLEMLATQAAAALDNHRLRVTLEQRVKAATAVAERRRQEALAARDHAEMLYRVSRTLAVTPNDRELLPLAIGLLLPVTNAERGGLLMLDQPTGRLAFRTTLDRATGSAAPSLERGMNLAMWAHTHRQTVVIPDSRHDPRWQNHGAEVQCRSVIATPLLVNNESIGVLLMAHATPEHFTLEQGKIAQAIAEQIAIALSKAQLHQHNIQQSERLQLALKQKDEEISRAQAILRSISDGVVVSDRLGRIRLINPAATQMLTLNTNNWIGKQISELPGARETSNGSNQIQLGERTLRADHAPIQLGNTWIGSVVVYRDITREALADRLKSEFIATASHELRTPLTSIRGYVDMLLLNTIGPLTPSQNDFLKVIKNNILYIIDLLDELLDVSRAEAGEIRLRCESTDIGRIIYEVSEALYSQFSERALSLTINITPDTPQVLADPQRIRQVVTNLMSNAAKYTPSGGQVNVDLVKNGQEIQVDVRDTGVGISPSAQPFIFTPFFRADNPLRDVSGGTGLGLSITKTLVELHGGRIWFVSKDSEGSIFSFTLPCT